MDLLSKIFSTIQGMEDSDSDEERCCMRRPKLLDQLKTILDTYPDDAQIIKELIQNAEDAGATEMKLLHDQRKIQPGGILGQYFKTPALCVYNDAEFTEEDWEGIKSIYISVKKNDKLKVGRFGLGFKSVFHLTDHPVIISGNKMLILDPLQSLKSEEDVCVTKNIKSLAKEKYSRSISHLQNAFGINENVLKGSYKGTFFWFPLRDKPSALSDNLYTDQKMVQLFNTFEEEASIVVLFLKSLLRIDTLYRSATSSEKMKTLHAVCMTGSQEDLEKRTEFKNEVLELNGELPMTSILSIYEVTVRMLKDNESFEKDWIIVNYIQGMNESPEQLTSLAQDPDLSYSPYVGVAYPCVSDVMVETGHVFCFLPLPLQKISMTGLPVHVNGLFALEQNRRHVKWGNRDQLYVINKDKQVLWNEMLIRNVLPIAYEELVDYLIQKSQNFPVQKNFIDDVVRSIPTLSQISCNWDLLLKKLIPKLLDTAIFYTENKGGKWLYQKDAIFPLFNPAVDMDMERTITKFFLRARKNFVPFKNNIKELVVNKKYNSYSPRGITPKLLRKILHSCSQYKRLNQKDKLNLLHYAAADETFSELNGIELLPLNDGTFINFESYLRVEDKKIYLCQNGEETIFVGLENRLVSTGDQFTEDVNEILQEIAENGTSQLQLMTKDEFPYLYQITIEKKNQENAEKAPMSDSFDLNWLEQVWKYIIANFDFNADQEILHRLPLIAERKSRKQTTEKLLPLKGFYMVAHCDGMSTLSPKLNNILRLFSITKLQALPDFLKFLLGTYVHYPNHESLLDLLSEVITVIPKEEIVYNLNRNSLPSDKEALVEVLSEKTASIPQNLKSLFRKIQMFIVSENRVGVINKSPKFVAVTQNKWLVSDFKFPVPYPYEMIDGRNAKVRELALKLGAVEKEVSEIVQDTLKIFLDKTQNETYSVDEVKIFMDYFLTNITMFDSNLLQMAQKVAFISTSNNEPCCARDLFDPRDKHLQILFYGEEKFPRQIYWSDDKLNALLKIGLKTARDVTFEEILETAKILDTLPPKKIGQKEYTSKAKKLKYFLNVLNIEMEIEQVNELQELRWVAVSKRTERFPDCLPWYSDDNKIILSTPKAVTSSDFCLLSGSVQSIVDVTEASAITHQFQWDKSPSEAVVLEQLNCIAECFAPKHRPQLLPVVANLYQHLSTLDSDYDCFKDKNCILCEDKFMKPCEVYIHEGKDTQTINLYPYISKLPTEFVHLESFFLALGCKEFLTPEIMIDVLEKIKEKHINESQNSKSIISYLQTKLFGDKNRTDLQLVIQIVKYLDALSLRDIHLKNVLLPVITKNDNLVLKYPSECTYADDDTGWLFEETIEENMDEDVIFYVHKEIEPEIAIRFGVPSRTNRFLTNNDMEDMVMEWGQSEPLTTRLNSLLEGYTDGFAIPKEIIQNADDAGATEVAFLYDERENMHARVHLIDPKMAECQGPALWAYNNSMFQETDFINIQKLGGRTKEQDESTIGKFGFGFCSVYNLTDVPSFYSGNSMVIFDPHGDYLGRALKNKMKPGLRFQMNQMIMKRFHNQFQPFNGVFKCNLSGSMHQSMKYKGTLFRLPLRTKKQAEKSKIKAIHYSREEISKLLDKFARSAGDLLLFTQSVKTIEVYHLPPTSTNPAEKVLLFSADKVNQRSIPRDMNDKHVLKYFLSNKEELFVVNQFKISVNITENMQCLCTQKKASNETNWLVAWGSSKDCPNVINGGVPIGATAVPVSVMDKKLHVAEIPKLPDGFYKSSHVFCFLPLPVKINLLFHLNGCFSVEQDRKCLTRKTEDEKTSERVEWNNAILSGAVCNSFLNLLESLKTLVLEKEYDYSHLWPQLSSNEKELSEFFKSFYYKIVHEDYQLLSQDEKWYSFKECCVLDPVLRFDNEIGDLAFDCLLQFSDDRKVVHIREDTILCLDAAECTVKFQEIVLKTEMFYSEIFFKNISSDIWLQKNQKIKERDKLTMYALKSKNRTLRELVKYNKCIPTKGRGTLKKPEELVHPKMLAASLFDDQDERFPTTFFCESDSLDALSDLGMKTDLIPFEWLKERANSIKSLNNDKAVKRCMLLLEYLRTICYKRNDHNYNLSELSDIEFLPLEEKPANWPIIWKNRTVQNAEKTFACPQELYFPGKKLLIGGVRLIVNSFKMHFEYDRCVSVLRKVGVNNTVSVDDVLNQLEVVGECNIENLEKEEKDQLKKICFEIYKYLNDTDMEKFEELEKVFTDMNSKSIILMSDTEGKDILIKPSAIAFNRPMYSCKPCDYSPYLYFVDSQLKQYEKFLKSVGIRENFSSSFLLSTIDECKKKLTTEPCSDKNKDAVLVVNIVKLLTDTFKQDKTTLSDDQIKNLIIPDEDCQLRSPCDLCYDDDYENLQKKPFMHFVHGSVDFDLIKILRIKSKRIKHLESFAGAMEFGQKESLITRLKGLLKGYPFDSTILNELLQNADDANATEIHFILDERTHPNSGLFDDSWKPLQGPSLLVYNNACFTESDIQGIQNLGTGNKSDDPTKTGQFGIGFNATYNLTDVPSFLTRGPGTPNEGTLCIFDPHCIYAPLAWPGSPGMQLKNLSQVQEIYPGIYNTYLQHEFPSNIGTWFRFPLRNKEMSQKSEICKGKVITVSDIHDLYNSFLKDMRRALLFVSNVQEIKLSRILKNDTKIQPIYSVKASLSDDDKEIRTRFNNYVKEAMAKLKIEQCSLTEIHFKEALYRIKIEDSRKQKINWLVVQRFGISDNTAKTLIDAVRNGEIGLTPRGGIALPLIAETKLQDHLKENQSKSKKRSKPTQQSKPKGKQMVLPPLNAVTVYKKMLKSMNFPQKIHIDDQKRTVIEEEIKEYKCKKKINEQSEKGDFKVFCFLPTPIRSGLPVHINGHFSLNPTRRNLFREGDKKSIPGEWNTLILNDIIPKAYVKGMEELRDYLMNLVHKQLILPGNAIEIYHLVFPNQTDTPEEYFQSLVDEVYRNIWENQIAVFPIQNYLSTPCNSNETATWVPLADDGSVFPAYFNDLYDQFKEIVDKKHENSKILSFNRFEMDPLKKRDMELAKEESTSLTTLLKNTGLKLVESPLWVLDALKKASITAKCVSPDDVTNFIKSQSECSSDQCRTVDVLKSGNTIDMIRKVKLLLSYCLKSSLFLEYIENMPLLVTEDNELHRFSSSRPVFLSSFYKLLPKSKDVFVNYNLVDLLKGLEEKSPSLKILDIQSLASLLSKSIDERIYKDKKGICLYPKQENDDIPNQKWLELFWEYLSKQQENYETVCQSDMKDWCFIPGKAHGEDILVSFEYGHRLLNLSSFSEVNRETAFATLQLPKPCLLQTSTMENFLANEHNALSVLNCLYYSVEHLRELDIEDDTCNEILKYLHGNVPIETEDTKTKLMKLPLYKSMSGTRTSLDNGNGMLILPRNIKTDGLDTWCEKAGLLLLPSDYITNPLLVLLGAQECNALQFYGVHFLPKFNLLEQEFIMTHLEYIRDQIIQKYSEQESKQIRKQLNSIKFIKSSDGHNKLVRAERFYSPFNEIFKIMCPQSKFPPHPFNGKEWRRFMEIAGMKSKITEDMFVEFAEQIERTGQEVGITETLENQSRKLVLHLFTDRQWLDYSSLLTRIKHIKFIVPHEVLRKYTNIYPALNKWSLICFSKSISQRYAEISWTVCNLLPQYADPKSYKAHTELEQTESHLDIYSKPTENKVICHAQNICPVLEKKCTAIYQKGKKLDPDRETIIYIMSKIYEFLSQSNHQIHIKESLCKTPIIHLYDLDLFCTAEQIILDISSEDEIIPYLFKAPVHYGHFHGLFKFLGSKEKLTCQHLANVLTAQKQIVRENTLSPEDLHATKKAVIGFFEKAQKDFDQIKSIQCLYLPSEDNKLYTAKSLIHCNKESFKKRLSQLKIQYLHQMNFTDREVNVESILRKLPNQIRPKILTDLVKEELEQVTMNEIVQDSENVPAIKQFICSSKFIKVVCFLIRQDNQKSANHVTGEQLAEIRQKIKSIKFYAVRHLQTLLKYEGNIVPGSEKQTQCYYLGNENEGHLTFYFKEGTGDISKRIRSQLSRLILHCTNKLINDQSFIILNEVVGLVPDICLIEPYLAEHDMNIDADFEYIEDEWFPRLGSYVPKHEYVLLDNSFTEFRIGEYVAYEIFDPDIDGTDAHSLTEDLNCPVYIYVKVIKKCSSENEEDLNPYLVKYLVNMGYERTETVFVIRMYKFVRKSTTDLAEYTGIQSAYDEAREEEVMRGIRKTLIQAWKLPDEKSKKRIIKRLYLFWHPDKNKGNEEFCTKVFQYIQEIIRQLENGEINIDSGDGPSYSTWNFTRHGRNTYARTWYSTFGENVNSRYHSSWTNYHSHSSSQQRSRSCNAKETEYVPNPQEHEARRWIKQAKADLAVAMGILNCRCDNLVDADTNNWICYISHQAAEKAIKAVTYNGDANKVDKTHRLRDAASAQPIESLRRKAAYLDDLLGNYFQMRYPDAVTFPRIPLELYTAEKAEEAVRRAQEIVTEVCEYLS